MVKTNSSMGEEVRSAITVYTSLIGVFGFIGNFLIILAFSQCRKLRTATNVFIVNLCGLNVLLSFCELLFSAPSAGTGHWLYGRTGCVVHGGLEFCCICVAMNTTAAISVDRFCVITKPQVGAKITFTRAVYWTLGIYIYTLVFTLPTFFGWPGFELLPSHSGCYLRWFAQDLSLIYACTIAIFLFGLPFGIMIYCYWSIYTAVKRRKRSPNIKSSPSPYTMPRNRKISVNSRPHLRTARMIVLVMCVYATVWGPCVVSSILRTCVDLLTFEMFEISVLFARSNVLWTAFIYGILNQRFRAVILTLLRCRTGSDWNTRDGRLFSTSFRDMSFFGNPRTMSFTSSTSRKKSTSDEPQSVRQKCVDLERFYKFCCCVCEKNNSYSPESNCRPAAVISNMNYPTVPVDAVDKNPCHTQTSVITLTSPVELSFQSNGVQKTPRMKAENPSKTENEKDEKGVKRVRLSLEQRNASRSCAQEKGLRNACISHSADIHLDRCGGPVQGYHKPRCRHSCSMGDISDIHRDPKLSTECNRRSGSFSLDAGSAAEIRSRYSIEEVRQYWAHRNLLLDDVS